MKKIKLILISLFVVLLTTSALINIWNNKDKIKTKFFNSKSIISESIIPDKKKNNIVLNEGKNESFYANDIINKGGYILFFRHAEREKWSDVTAYDAHALIMSFDEESSYFEKAVCLSKRGKVQAQMMGDFVNFLDIPIQKVISSPSCRATQTSILAFGGIDEIENLLLHYGPFNEDMDEFNESVKKLILKNQPQLNSNIIYSAHNGVIFSSLIDEYLFNTDSFNSEKFFHLEEGGFYVMKVVKNQLVMVFKFDNFQNFLKPLLKRKL